MGEIDMITDNLSDTFTRIRNALSSKKKTVIVLYSNLIERIIRLIKNVGYIKNIKIIHIGTIRYISIELKYEKRGTSIITGIKRISRPGLRIYCKEKHLPIIIDVPFFSYFNSIEI